MYSQLNSQLNFFVNIRYNMNNTDRAALPAGKEGEN